MAILQMSHWTGCLGIAMLTHLTLTAIVTVTAVGRKHEKKPPVVSGFDIAVLDTWAAQQQGKDSPLEGIGAFGAALLGGQDSLNGSDREGPASLVSAKEERDLQTLLEMFAMGVGDVEQFQSRLQDELAALEVQRVGTDHSSSLHANL